jgi:4-hydroxy-3-methylbut-2-en-1-yl diphosphate reductase
MKVEVDQESGFCFGVENAVEIAEQALKMGEKIYCLGQLVHNDIEVSRLSKLGLVTITREKYKELKDCKVLIRAHGEPPETYQIAQNNNIELIDATCPIVKRLQARIKKAWDDAVINEGQVVIYGKADHAEVRGLLGQTDNKAILINDERDIEKIDLKKSVFLFSQTTMNLSNYKQIADKIRSRMRESGVKYPGDMVHVHNTICGQVSNREPKLKEFAINHDVIVFVSGKESSNGKMLYSICKKSNPLTYFISSPDEIDFRWFSDKESVGICGATSTPKWLIDNIHEKISSELI